MYKSSIVLCLAVILTFTFSVNQSQAITPDIHKAKTVELFKELVALNNQGIFPSEKGLSKGNPLAHAWYLKWKKVNSNPDALGIQYGLRLPDGDVVWCGDLYQLAKCLYRGDSVCDRNKYQDDLMTRFKLAVEHYEKSKATPKCSGLQT